MIQSGPSPLKFSRLVSRLLPFSRRYDVRHTLVVHHCLDRQTLCVAVNVSLDDGVPAGPNTDGSPTAAAGPDTDTDGSPTAAVVDH